MIELTAPRTALLLSRAGVRRRGTSNEDAFERCGADIPGLHRLCTASSSRIFSYDVRVCKRENPGKRASCGTRSHNL